MSYYSNKSEVYKQIGKDELKKLNETTARSKSNSKRLDELKTEIKISIKK